MDMTLFRLKEEALASQEGRHRITGAVLGARDLGLQAVSEPLRTPPQMQPALLGSLTSKPHSIILTGGGQRDQGSGQ